MEHRARPQVLGLGGLGTKFWHPHINYANLGEVWIDLLFKLLLFLVRETDRKSSSIHLGHSLKCLPQPGLHRTKDENWELSQGLSCG